MKRALRRAAAAALLVALPAVLIGAGPAGAAGPKRLKISAHLYYEQHSNDGGGCGWSIGVAFSPVSGAASYTVEYYDGYYKQLESATKLAKDFEKGQGGLVLGITGGNGSGPCDAGNVPDPTEGGRFSKGAKAYANFALDHKEKPSLKVAVSLPDGGVPVGGSVTATVTVTAGELKMTGVSLGRGLDIGGSLAEVTKKPSKLSGFSLGAGQSKSFDFTIKARSPGAAPVSAKATGNSKKGSASGKGSATLRIAKAQLALTMATEPAKVQLTVNDDGTIEPADATVTVAVTNTGETPVDGVSLQSINPEPVKEGQRLDQLRLPQGSLPADLGTIAPKATISRDFTLHVTGDGKYQLRGLALYADGDRNGRVTAVGGKFEAVVPALFFAPKLDPQNIEYRNGAPFVIGGKTWYVNGPMKNESSYRTLCVFPMVGNPTGNAAVTGMVDIQQSDLRGTGGAFAGVMKPGQDVSLSMFVDTALSGASRSTVAPMPHAGVIEAGEKCDEKTYKKSDKLGEADIAIPSTGSAFSVGVDVSTPVMEALGTGGRTVNFFGGIARSLFVDFFVDTAQQGLDLLALGKSWGSTLQQYGGVLPLVAADQAFRLTVKGVQAVETATDVYASYWNAASAGERKSLIETAQKAVDLATHDFGIDVSEVARPYMDKIESAAAKGDDATEWQLYGQVTGSVVQQVVLSIFFEKFQAKLAASEGAALEAKVAEATRDWEKGEEAAALAAESESKVKVARKGVPPGTELDLEAKQHVWGIDKASDEAYARVAKDFDVKIGVRSRGVGAIEETKKGSVWKHENLKPKNVNPTDVEYLGFKPEDLDQVRLRTYTDEQVAAITNRIREDASLSPNEKLAILDRFETRLNEGKEAVLGKIEKFAKHGEIDVGFNYSENGIARPTQRRARRFQLESEAADATGTIPAGGVYYTPLQENLELRGLRRDGKLPANCRRALSSVLCTVTGDIDGVYITKVDGTAVDSDTMVRIYKRLQDAGWQHPESLTWIDNQGNFLFSAKEGILKGLEIGGEAIVEYAPDGGSRAVYLDLKKSQLLGKDNTNFHLHILGGYTGPPG